MALTINTNLFALNAQRNLRKTETPLTTAMQRLSSGLRINSAKDDAAGLAIATRMTRQVNGLSVAMRNANDGLSIAQTAEGAIEELTSALQRMNELAEQAASYNTNLDRQSLNSEVSQLIDELSRIVNEHLSGKVDHNFRLWIWINLEVWYRMYFENESVESMQSFVDTIR